jgi:HEAT repeat protein
MSTPTCPECGAAVPLVGVPGRSVRCTTCGAAFVPPTSTAQEPLDVQPVEEDVHAGSPVARRTAPDRRDRRGSRSPSGPAPAPRRKGGGVLWVVLLAVGIPVLAILLVCGGGVYYVYSTARSVGEQFNPKAPANFAEALTILSTHDQHRYRVAADWLARQPLDEGRRPEVSKALDPLLTDHDSSVREPAVRAMKVWATAENVPSLCQYLSLSDQVLFVWSGDERRTAIEVLARFKDPRSAKPLAERLANPSDRSVAGDALVGLGQAAVPEVNRLLDHPDQATREEARRVLKEINPADDVDLRLALLDVKSRDAFRRRTGADALCRIPPAAAVRAEGGHALEALLRDNDPLTRDNAARALVTWAGKENVPALIRAVNDDSPRTRSAAMEALAPFKDPRAAAALAAHLTTEPGEAGPALEALGPVAEKEVVRFYFDANPAARAEARRLLRVYGTKDELLLAQAVADVKGADAGRVQEACRWLAKSPRDERLLAEVSKALNGPLNDASPATRAEAVRALAVWATRENVPGLVTALRDFPDDFFAKENTAVRQQAIDTLGKLKDAKAAAALAAQLGAVPGDRAVATAALIATGPVAVPEVNKLIDHTDPGVRDAARRVLKEAGGGAVDVPAVLAELQANDAGRRRAAAERLPLVPAEDEARDKVARALEPLLEDADPKARLAGARALAYWATKENYDALLKAAGQEAAPVRQAALTGLGTVRDARAAALLVKRLDDPDDRPVAARALEILGPAAEADVLKALDSKEVEVRRVACQVLKTVGTKTGSLDKLKAVGMTDPDAQVQNAAWDTWRFLAYGERRKP